MYTTTMSQPDPGVFMRQFLSSEAATKANKWQGRNITRWQNADYDKLHDQSDGELDPVKRAAMFIAMDDLVIKNVVVIPVVTRSRFVTCTGWWRCCMATGGFRSLAVSTSIR